jgi:hypothetical protein
MINRFAGILLLLAGLLMARTACALDFFFSPDTTTGDTGQTILLSGQINASDLMRGFTVYMAYDTNALSLAAPPAAGSLIVNHQGLQFNYFDHAPFEPDVLEIGGTIFGTDFWQGPGELFQVRFTLRQCGVEQLTTPYAPFFVAADQSYPTVTFNPATVRICFFVPASPQGLTIYPNTPSSTRLVWRPVTLDFNSQPLPTAPVYNIYRQQILPSEQPDQFLVTVSDTFYTDNDFLDGECVYHVSAQTTP